MELIVFLILVYLAYKMFHDDSKEKKKHKVKVIVETEKQGLFGKKKVREEKIIEVDDKTYKRIQEENKKTYKKLQEEYNNRPYTVEEMMFYDELFDEWDD